MKVDILVKMDKDVTQVTLSLETQITKESLGRVLKPTTINSVIDSLKNIFIEIGQAAQDTYTPPGWPDEGSGERSSNEEG